MYFDTYPNCSSRLTYRKNNNERFCTSCNKTYKHELETEEENEKEEERLKFNTFRDL